MRPIFNVIKKEPFLVSVGLLVLAGAIWRNNPLVAEIIKEHNLVDQKAKVVAISYYYPTFSYFTDIVTGAAQPEKKLMESYYLGKPYIFHTYYQKAVDLLPEIDSAHFLLAYCEYYMGNPDTASVQFEKSTDINPYFFWSYYNLGVIYFQQGDYYKSAVAMSKALDLRKEMAVAILSQSPFYRQIWRSMANPPQTMMSNLDQGQKDAALLLAACLIKAKGYDQALKVIQTIGNGSPWHQVLCELLRKQAQSRQPAGDEIDRLIQEQIPVRLF